MSAEAVFKVQFAIESEERLRALTRAYDRIRECKAKNVWPETKEEWTPYFDSKALRHFWWPTPQEFEEWTQRYFSTPVPSRFSDPTLQHPWDFLSLFEAFKNGDYELLPIERQSDGDTAILPFDPAGHPYGGTGCMRALIQAFDHRVTEESE
jgi:hypothetical protein